MRVPSVSVTPTTRSPDVATLSTGVEVWTAPPCASISERSASAMR
jgi:hypothetical protein